MTSDGSAETCCTAQADRVAAAEALVAALVASQKQFDAKYRAANVQLAGTLEQTEGGSRQQRMEQALSCCSPHMVSRTVYYMSGPGLQLLVNRTLTAGALTAALEVNDKHWMHICLKSSAIMLCVFRLTG
jgi:hypothetical protein